MSQPTTEFKGTLYESMTIDTIGKKVGDILKLMTQAKQIAYNMRSFGTDHAPQIPIASTDEDQARDLQPHQRLLNFYFQQASNNHLRRKNKALYRPIILNDNTHTQFYQYYMEIEDYIYRSVTSERQYTEFHDILTHKPSTPPQMIRLFTNIPDVRCPFLEKERCLFSYQNGILDVRTGEFHTYKQSTFGGKCTSQYFDFFIPEELLHGDHTTIETPSFDKILEDQDFDAYARFWLYALCGRLFHDVGDMDDWQVALFIRGVAGSGKSSILNVLKLIYEADDLGQLMSDGQKDFSDEHLLGKNIVMANDIDKKCNMSATRVNSMISGETLSVNRKHKTALNMKWVAPMALASNSQPPWDDVAGNLTRRFVIMKFNNAIRHTDTQLSFKLKKEAPLLVLKMTKAYLEAIQLCGSRSVWETGLLPEMCHLAKKEYLVANNPISAFMESDYIEFNPIYETKASAFRKALLLYMRENGDRRSNVSAVSKVDHGHIFTMYGCSIHERVNPSGTTSVMIQGMKIESVVI
jgi:phage/plasmid-associated DNA primase